MSLSAQRYTISELELTGIYANITAFKHLLRNSNFTLYCDHSALVHIMNGKKEPPTLRLKKLMENLSDYKFDLKFLRGKDMFVSDFLSRHPDNGESCNDPIIPVAFLMKEIVLPEHSPKFMKWLNVMLDTREMLAYKTRDYKDCQCERVMSMKEPFRIMTRSMAKTANAEVPAMYPLQGDHKKPEKSQIGIIEVKDKEEQGQGEIQVDNNTHQPNDEIMAEIDSVNIPDRVIKPIAHRVPNINMGDLQIPPALNEPIPMKPVKKATPVIDYDQILAPVNIDVTLKGQLPPFDMENGFEAIHTTAEQLPDLESLFREDKPLFKPCTEISLFMKHIPKITQTNRMVKEVNHSIETVSESQDSIKNILKDLYDIINAMNSYDRSDSQDVVKTIDEISRRMAKVNLGQEAVKETMTKLQTSLTSPRSQRRGYYQTVECDDPHYENKVKHPRLSSNMNFAYFDKQYGEVLEVNKNREVRRGLKERFLELHEKAQKWEILAYHLKVICAENPEIEPLPDLENDAYLKREEAYLTIATVSKLFKHLEFVSQQHPNYNSLQDLITIMFEGLVERKIAPAMVYHWLTHQMFWSLCQYEDNREFDVLTDVILLYREFNPAAKPPYESDPGLYHHMPELFGKDHFYLNKLEMVIIP